MRSGRSIREKGWFWQKMTMNKPFSYDSAKGDRPLRLTSGLTMTIERVVVAFTGSLVLVSLVLSRVHYPYWLWLTAFVGANLVQSAFTDFCPSAKILKALGIKSGEDFK